MPIYTIGRTYLLELFHSPLQADLVRFVDGPMSGAPTGNWRLWRPRCAKAERSTRCPPGQHDDLGISCAMLAWAARHPHLRIWMQPALPSRASAYRSWGGVT